MNYSLHGSWTADIGDGESYLMNLPGTLDENRIGHRDQGTNQWHPDSTLGREDEVFSTDVIATRFTRNYTYEGEARITRRIEEALGEAVDAELAEGKRIFLEAERARVLHLLVDGKEIADFIEPSISTRHVFEVTDAIRKESELTLLSDNSYPGLPHDAITYSSAATDETQTNWNGILGYLRLRTENQVFLDDIRVYPIKNLLSVKMKLYVGNSYSGTIRVHCDALQEDAVIQVSTSEAVTELCLDGLKLKENVRRWDLDEGNLYELFVSMERGEAKKAVFGVRDFGDDGRGRLAVNGRTIFLRSETNCAEFPETGYPPMTLEAWKDILERYRSYGVNCVRFHSHCPPEAAFTAADQIGMLMQPELSHWNPRDAFEADESWRYYRTELVQILDMLANHPSFVMLSLGNELHAGPKGHERMRMLLRLAQETDSTRLYADASNRHYGAIGCDEMSGFYTASDFYDWKLRGASANRQGYINNHYPDAQTNYNAAMDHLRKEYAKPVFSFEVGQFEVLPDFDELALFRGISDPANLRLIQERVESQGLTEIWKKYVEATGELARICYREEVEAVMRTGEMSGISLLGLQDFPGQGTALVGMLNSHLRPKPYHFAQPENFRIFFTDQLPLVLLPRYTWVNTEKLSAQVQIANFGKRDLCGIPEYALSLQTMDQKGYSCADGVRRSAELVRGTLSHVNCPAGTLTDAGILEIDLKGLSLGKPVRLNLTVQLEGISNLYPIWVYPQIMPQCPGDIYETQWLDPEAKKVLKNGGKVYLTPPSTKEALPFSIQAQFTTDFWSVGTFAEQEGAMGQLIDDAHPLFEGFPTEFHTNWQWWPMASQRAVILSKRYQAVIAEMDSYAFLRPMAQLLECRCGGGKLMFSSMGLQDLQRYPEARALLDAIYCYMESEKFAPEQMIDVSEIERLAVRP